MKALIVVMIILLASCSSSLNSDVLDDPPVVEDSAPSDGNGIQDLIHDLVEKARQEAIKKAQAELAEKVLVDIHDERLRLAFESSDNNLKLARLYIEDASTYREEVLQLRERLAKLEATHE